MGYFEWREAEQTSTDTRKISLTVMTNVVYIDRSDSLKVVFL